MLTLRQLALLITVVLGLVGFSPNQAHAQKKSKKSKEVSETSNSAPAKAPTLMREPMLAYAQHREAAIVLQPSFGTKTVALKYFKQAEGEAASQMVALNAPAEPNRPVTFVLTNLDMGTKYGYRVMADGQMVGTTTYNFTTRMVWEYRGPTPDFTFAIGSCTYINDSLYDRPVREGGKPYGKETSILSSISKADAAFNLWLGDNVYLREADYSSESGVRYRYAHDFADKNWNTGLLSARPNYAIWDDHDFGPNDAVGDYALKATTAKAFKEFWGVAHLPHPNSKGEGIYRSFTHADCEFFLLDDRTFREPLRKGDSLEVYWGAEQLAWLQASLRSSKASFKFIVNGNQVLNPGQVLNPPRMRAEGVPEYQADYKALLNFIQREKIEGVVFLSGDRHFTELMKLDEKRVGYPLYEYTNSPLTSSPYAAVVDQPEIKANKAVVEGSVFTAQNFGLLKVTGPREDRVLTFQTVDATGKVVWTFEIPAKSLREKKE